MRHYRDPCQLSPREREVAVWLAKPMTCKAIAEKLLVSHKTVRVHASAIYAKVGVRTRFEFMALMTGCTVEAEIVKD